MTIQDDKKWRLLDTGVRRAAENFAMNRAILEAHQQGDAPHTIRFLSFEPSALLGFHQDAEQELNLDYIRDNNIDIQRRVTGGGALYFDQQQIGWELYLNKKIVGTTDMTKIATRICETAARGMQKLGVDAKFRPRNDIEVNGRKVSGTGGAFDGDSILYQGTLLIEFDVEKMMRVLRIPAEKINDKSISDARERIITFRDILGDAIPGRAVIQQTLADTFAEEFGIELESSSEINAAEQVIFAEALAAIDSDDWIYQHNRPKEEAPMVEALYKSKGGLLRASVIINHEKDRLSQLWLTGDFFIKPRRLVVDLEAALRNSKLSEMKNNVQRFFDENETQMLMLGADDFITVIQMAVDKVNEASLVGNEVI